MLSPRTDVVFLGLKRRLRTQPPLGLNVHTKGRFPRVARSEQPWALLRNPFGIETWLLATLRGLEMRRLDEGGYGDAFEEEAGISPSFLCVEHSIMLVAYG